MFSILLPRTNQSHSTEEIRQLAHQATIAAPTYTNDWAVQVEGSLGAVNAIANRHGFINMGQVHMIIEYNFCKSNDTAVVDCQIGNLDGYYHFQLNISLFVGHM